MIDRHQSPALRICEFVNTLEVETGADSLGPWLAERGVRPAPARLARAAELREALRTLLLANNGVRVETARAAAAVEEAARRARLAVRVEPARLEPSAGGLDGALGELVAAVAVAGAAGTWSRIKACRAEDCRWAFVDGARNRSRRWCSMEVCGNRAKARRFRARVSP